MVLAYDFCPIVVVPMVPKGKGGIRFLHQNEQIDIVVKDSRIIWDILEQCNGYSQLTDIADKTGISLQTVCKIVQELVDLEVIVDSRKQYQHFHKISNYPTRYSKRMTQTEVQAYTKSPRSLVKSGLLFDFVRIGSRFEQILQKRRSCRNFSTAQLNQNLVGSICYYGYSIFHHHVPSGGALYPLKLYILVEKPQIDLPAGYYEYDAEKNVFVQFEDLVDIEQLKHCFNSEDVAFGSSVQIVIAGDLNRQTYKYSNRGYRLTLLEAGHVAENICLFCAEQGLGTCELGGILDEPLRIELQMETGVYPLLAIAIGYESSISHEPFDELNFLEQHSRDFGFNPNLCNAITFDDSASFFGATVQYGADDCDIAGATSTSYVHAIFKASIEGYERKISGMSRVDFDGSAVELQKSGKPYINPALLAPLTSVQAKNCGVVPFSRALPIQWTKGFSYQQNCEVYIPTDIVYYGHKPGKNQIYIGNSSGVAAHLDEFLAKKHALIELIERDAIMRNWYHGTPPPMLSQTALPIHIRKRNEYWANNGRKLFILDLPSLYAKVILVAIVSDEYPCFVCGAAASLSNSNEEVEQTINKALQEAEYCLYSCLKWPNYDRIEPKKVRTPNDHGRLYHFPEYISQLKWLWSGPVCDKIPACHSWSFETLSHSLDLLEVNLSSANNPIKVIRMLSPKLIPISFGYYNVHFTHPELNGKCGDSDLTLPHYFA